MKLSDLLSEERIAIQCHNIPDADALASGFGLYRFFEANNKSPRFFYGGPPISKPNLTGMIEALRIPVEHAPDLKEWDGLLITVDCQHGAGNVARVSAPRVAVIDHHIQEGDLPALCDLRPWLGSCATLVWNLLLEESFPIDIRLSTALQYGLFTDTNSFSEVKHPLDRDMWETLVTDTRILKKLKLSNLSLPDLTLTSNALNHIAADAEDRFALISAPPCDPNLLGFISDLSMQVDTVDMVVAYSTSPTGDVKYSVRTSTREVKASELAAWLAEGIGSGGGHREKAGGYIAGGKYKDRFGDKAVSAYVTERIRDYLASCVIIDCADPASLPGGSDLAEMRTYRKLPTRLGFVPCRKLFSGQCELQLRMLEGDMDIQADEDTVLMIGILGEVYPIEQRKFMESYQVTAEAFTPDLHYAPTALNKNTGTRLSLLDFAETCLSLSTGTVSAMRLHRRVKVFTRWDSENYFSGNPGDWIVARSPDDFYVVTADVFGKIYALDYTGVDVARQAGAQRVLKNDTPVAVIFAESDGILETPEGAVRYAKGDALLTDEAGSWPVRRALFDETYEPLAGTQAGKDGPYCKRDIPVWGLRIEETFAVELSGQQGVLQGCAGDWLLQYGPDNYGVVAASIFEKTYSQHSQQGNP
jgi:phosphoglycolate phosphatase